MKEWISIGSTAIRRIGYEAETMRMYIDFEDSNPIYTFYRIPESIFRKSINARSCYYHQYIKGRYNY